MIALWQPEEQASRPVAQFDGPFLKALADIAAIPIGTQRPIGIWTVNA